MNTLELNLSAQKASADLRPYLSHLREVVAGGRYDAPESSINLVSDAALLSQVKQEAARLGPISHLLLIGIGGSNLGTVALYEALKTDTSPQLTCLDTVDADKLRDAVTTLKNVEASKIAVVLVSKSGTTTESLVNFEIVYAELLQSLGSSTSKLMDERIVVITDEGTPLWDAAGAKNWGRLAIPKMVGGRYSVFSAVGLLPLMLLGIDVEDLLAGAREMRERCVADADNPALDSALARFAAYEAGQRISVDFFFASRLENVGKWHRQLLAESLGKEGKGLTPTVAIGSTDLHSMGQLYLGGPKDKFTTFVHAKEWSSLPIPHERVLPDVLPMISGKDTSQIMQAILQGTQAAYKTAELSYLDLALKNVSARSLGALLMFWVIETMLLGQLLGVNAFDQPSVESYKKETRRLLES